MSYKLMCSYPNEEREDELLCTKDTEDEAERTWEYYTIEALVIDASVCYYIVAEE